MGDIELGIVAALAWSAAATFVVEPREFRERFARNRAAARLCATPRNPRVRQWFGESYNVFHRATFIPTVGDWRSWHERALDV